jgi:hypothetical protein
MGKRASAPPEILAQYLSKTWRPGLCRRSGCPRPRLRPRRAPQHRRSRALRPTAQKGCSDHCRMARRHCSGDERAGHVDSACHEHLSDRRRLCRRGARRTRVVACGSEPGPPPFGQRGDVTRQDASLFAWRPARTTLITANRARKCWIASSLAHNRAVCQQFLRLTAGDPGMSRTVS